jgi:Ran-binding protein 1
MSSFASLSAQAADKETDAISSAANPEEDEENEGEEESSATFVPRVHLEEVEVKTGEEEEDIKYCQRSKLYTFSESMLNKGTGKKTWNERGIGEIKILKHKESGRLRVLMRQEKTKKIIANHALDPRIELEPNAGAADKSWVWVAYDFAENELVETTFAIKFKDCELAGAFKENFEILQTEMASVLAGEDSAEGTAEADEAGAAIASLGVDAKKPEEGAEEGGPEATKEAAAELEAEAPAPATEK